MSSKQASSTRFDWASAKLRLQAVQDANSAREELSPAESSQLLSQRAEHLARVPEPELDTTQTIELVRFRLGREHYAIATAFVLELTRKRFLTWLPQTSDYFLGVMNLRGRVTLVVDLARYFNIEVDPEERDQILVLGTAEPEIAILVDAVDHVLSLPRAALLEPVAATNQQRELTLGCTQQGMAVLDGEALLGCQELYVEQDN